MGVDTALYGGARHGKQRSARGTIIGGGIWSAHEVSAIVLGSRAEARTEVALGGLPCQEFDHEVLVREIGGLEEELEKTERQPESPDKFNRIGKLRMQIAVNKNKLEQFDRHMDEEREEQEAPGVRRLTCDVAKEYFNILCGHIAATLYRTTRVGTRFSVTPLTSPSTRRRCWPPRIRRCPDDGHAGRVLSAQPVRPMVRAPGLD